ncbi:MAG TPA: dienelactone hydrolase family protein [Pyrinomonadaceae bacterium]|nr:dienelactone hydrolase family protein [Pyrinomonadaceae bacterium]
MEHGGHTGTARIRTEQIPSAHAMLEGELIVPAAASGIVLFAHGSGSSRHSPRNQFVARTIREAGFGTLLFDLLTKEEEAVDLITRKLRFDIGLLADRLVDVTKWIQKQPGTAHLRVGYFGSSTGAGAALVAAAALGEEIGAVVSRGGRPDLAGEALSRVKSPTLLIVGELDYPVIKMNEEAYHRLRCEKELKIVPGASHLFEEPGTLEEAARLAADWFRRKLRPDEVSKRRRDEQAASI